jgi:hypothetical protein
MTVPNGTLRRLSFFLRLEGREEKECLQWEALLLKPEDSKQKKIFS